MVVTKFYNLLCHYCNLYGSELIYCSSLFKTFYGRLSSKVPSHFLFENIDYVCDLRHSKSMEMPKISFFQPSLVR